MVVDINWYIIWFSYSDFAEEFQIFANTHNVQQQHIDQMLKWLEGWYSDP